LKLSLFQPQGRPFMDRDSLLPSINAIPSPGAVAERYERILLQPLGRDPHGRAERCLVAAVRPRWVNLQLRNKIWQISAKRFERAQFMRGAPEGAPTGMHLEPHCADLRKASRLNY